MKTTSLSSLTTQIQALRKIKDPLLQMQRVVELGTSNFAWGLNPAKALLGNDGKRAVGMKVSERDAAAGGGDDCEFTELNEAAKELKKARKEKRPKAEIAELEAKAAGEAADVLTMTRTLIKRLGISDESLDTALKESNINKYCDRFANILEFVKRGHIELKDIANVRGKKLKENGKLFDALWCAVKKKETELKKEPRLFDTLGQAFNKFKDICLEKPSKFFGKLWETIEKYGTKALKHFLQKPAAA